MEKATMEKLVIEKEVEYKFIVTYGVPEWKNIYKGFEVSNMEDELSIFIFKSEKKARDTYQILSEFKEFPNILPARDFYEKYMITDKLHMTFQQWKGQQGKELWRLNPDGQLREIEPDLLKVTDAVIETLRLLHKNDKYHGNLMNGISIDENDRVTLFNFRKHTDDVGDGIIGDLEALRTLVTTAASVCDGAKNSKAVQLFEELYKELPTSDVAKALPLDDIRSLRSFAYLLYYNAFFWTGNVRCMFSTKVGMLRRKDMMAFDNELNFEGGLIDFDWKEGKIKQMIKKNKTLGTLVRVRHKTYKDDYNTRQGVIEFLMQAYPHCADRRKPIFRIDVDEALQGIFPEVVPIIFYGVVTKFRHCPELFFPHDGNVKTLVDLICREYPTIFQI